MDNHSEIEAIRLAIKTYILAVAQKGCEEA
jgi:hypothetical protein